MPGENHPVPQYLHSAGALQVGHALVSLQPHPVLQELNPGGSAGLWNVAEQPSGMRLTIVALWHCKALFLKDTT